MCSLIPAATSSAVWYKAIESASLGADTRATMDAMAGAVARTKPADVKKIEKAEMVIIRRKRAPRRFDEGDAADRGQN